MYLVLMFKTYVCTIASKILYNSDSIIK